MSDGTTLCLTIDEKLLVFGMDWLPILGGRASQQAISKARRHKATHYVVASEHAAAMGLIQLPRAASRSDGVLFSAAQAVASMFPSGTVALSLLVKPGVYWLVAVHEGAVVARTDLLFTDLVQAQTLLTELRSAYTQLRFIEGGQHSSGAPGLPELACAADERSQLRKLGQWGSKVRPRFGVLLLMAMTGLAFWWVDPYNWVSQSAARPEPMTPARQLQAWEHARKVMSSGVYIQGVGGMQRLLASLYQVPLLISGWQLGQVSCKPDGASWRCTAAYRRVMQQADNQGLIESAPPSWQLRFLAVDHIEADWVVERAGSPLLSSPLDDARQADKYWLSSLQQIASAFVTIKATSATALALTPPVDDQGQSIPRPADFRLYQRRLFQAEGPLRSYSLLLPNLMGVRWHVLTLSLKEINQSTLKQSRLYLSGQGERYEWQM